MERIILRLSGPKLSETKVHQTVEVPEGENYHLALGRSLIKAQDDFNTLLTEIIDENKKKQEGTMAERKAKKMKKESF